MLKIAVLISGNGSNLQTIISGIESKYLNCEIIMVISDREGAYGIERAKQKNIRTFVLPRKVYGKTISEEILKIVDDKVELIVLAGFLSILKGEILSRFKNRIINIHPSLIPSFCGHGMYGIKVHEEAVRYGVKYSGCTVHFVDDDTDSGAIIAQSIVPVYNQDTAETLQSRILEEEHKLLPEVIRLITEEKVKIEGRKVFLYEGGIADA